MSDRKGDAAADLLREKAALCFQLAFETTDPQVRDMLSAYGHELLEQAKALIRASR